MSYKKQTRQYILIALVISLGFSVYTATRPHDEFAGNNPGPEVLIEVSNGEFGAAIAADLYKEGVIKTARTFIDLANQPSSGAQGISPGNHKIQTRITSKQALAQLLDRTRFTHMVDVIEGSTFGDVKRILAKDSTIKRSSSESVKPALVNGRNSLEGQLAPASYTFAKGTTTAQALAAMIEKFSQTTSTIGLSKGFEKYSAYQVLTIASLIQIEGDPADYPKVAGVIYNRLRIGMPLQLNSTVQYAAGLRGQIALSTAATKIDSPYNTYRNIGLPPTPISNPSISAITAALHPAHHDFLYFITVKPHDTRFTKDYTQFDAWVTEYNKNRAAGLFA